MKHYIDKLRETTTEHLLLLLEQEQAEVCAHKREAEMIESVLVERAKRDSHGDSVERSEA